jgi:membrane-bound lytic murein transglycosylase D
VPQYIAIIYAMNYATEHNIHEYQREETLSHDTLAVNQFLHLDTFAKLTGTCVEDLQSLNPHVKRNAIPEDGKIRTIKIPKSSKEVLSQNRKTILDSSATGKKELESLAKTASDYTYGRDRNVYYVRNGDVLGTIAHRFGVSVRNLREWNNLRGNLIRVGQRLIIWANSSAKAKQQTFNTSSVQYPTDTKTYIVQPGDTLSDISKKLPGISIERIKSLNNLKENKLQPGQKLIVG